MADDSDFSVPVAVVWTLIALVIIAVVLIVFCWWRKIWIFSSAASIDERLTEQHNNTDTTTTVMNASAVGTPYAGDLNVLHLKTINGVPAPGSSFPRPPISISLLTIFPNPQDKALVTREPNRFRLYFYCAHFRDSRSRPEFPQTSGQAGFARYEAPLQLAEKGKYEIYCYSVVWKGPTPLSPPLPPANPTPLILAQFCVKFEYFVGVDPRSFGGGRGNSSVHIEIDEDDDLFPGFAKHGDSGSFVVSPENLLEMQRILALHLRPPPGTYVAPLDVHASTALCDRYKVTISPQHLITSDETQMFTLSVTGNHIVKLTSRNPASGRAPIDMAAVYVIVPPAPDIVPSKGSITELMPISISSPSCIADVTLKHFYAIDSHEPNQLYNVPFTIPCGEGNSERHCRIVAKTIGRDGTQSQAAVADLHVLSGNAAVYDPSIPSPICIVAALEPRLVLKFNDSHDYTHHGPNASSAPSSNYVPSDVIFYYRVVKDEQRKRNLYRAGDSGLGLGGDDDDDDGDGEQFKIYNPAVAIAINESHCRIEAYAERIPAAGSGGKREQSATAHYSWSESMMEAARGTGGDANASKASSASRPQSARRQQHHGAGVSSSQRDGVFVNPPQNAKGDKTSVWSQQQIIQQQQQQQYHQLQQAGGHNTSLKPPIMSVECSGATMAFEDAPHKNYVVRYSLDGAALDENWKEFQHGTEVDVSEYLKAFGKIEVFARYYIERSSPTEPTIYGRSFSRSFTMPFMSSVKWQF